jgi:DNA-binding PadR family transcriptional regulator
MTRPLKRSAIALAVLAMLHEEPMHPYKMQRLIKDRAKDEVINVEQRASLYQTIQRLQRDDLIAVKSIIRSANRPERTVYAITSRGRSIMLTWMREILSTPGREYPEFPAAVSFLALLTPEDASRQLETRAKALHTELKRIDRSLQQAAAVPRLFLLEMEFLRAVQATELAWVKSVMKDMRAARLTWSEEWLRRVAAQFAIDSESDVE